MRYLLIILLSFSAIVTTGSTPLKLIDSLKVELNNSKSQERVKILINISEAYRFLNMAECDNYGLKAIEEAKKLNNPILEAKSLKSIAISNYFDGKFDKAIEYTNRSLHIFRKIEDNEGLAACYNNIGVFYEEKGEIDSALTNYEKSFHYEKLRGDKLGMAYSYLTIGNAYYYRDELVTAIDNYFKSLKLMQEINDDEGSAKLYNVIGVIYEDSKEYDKALEFYSKAEEVFMKLGNDENLGRVYMNLGELYSQESKKYKLALEYFNKALNIKKASDDKTGIALAYNNLGYLYSYLEDYKTALNYLNKSYEIYSEVDSKNGLVMVEYNLGTVYSKLDKYEKAIYYLQNSLKLVNGYGFDDFKMPVYEELLKVYAIYQPDKDLFEKHFNSYISYKDSIIDKLSSSQIREVELKLNADKIVQDASILMQVNKENDLQKYQLTMWLTVIGGVLTFILLIYILFFRNRI